MPLDGNPRAAYALIHPDRTLELRRVRYDTAAAIGALRETFGATDWVAMISGRLERARP
jgi:hypothetical protein